MSIAIKSRVLVTGASGAVGPRVVEALCAEGYLVRTLSLNNGNSESPSQEVEVLIGDITNPADVEVAVQDCDAVIHLAALLHIVDPPDSLRPRYEHVNIGGTVAVVDAAIQAGVRRVVYFSTINVYGPTAGQIIDEGCPPNPDTFYAGTKLAAEKIVLGAKNRDGKPLGVVLRLGAVYGSRIRGNYSRLLQSLAKKRFIPVGDGKNRRTLVYDKDVARAALLALSHLEAAGKVYNVTDGTYHTVSEIVTTICASLGRTQPQMTMPVGPVRLAAGIMEDGARLVGLKSPISRSTVDKYTEDIAVDGTRIQNELGFIPSYDLAGGWRETVTEMKKRGEL